MPLPKGILPTAILLLSGDQLPLAPLATDFTSVLVSPGEMLMLCRSGRWLGWGSLDGAEHPTPRSTGSFGVGKGS